MIKHVNKLIPKWMPKSVENRKRNRKVFKKRGLKIGAKTGTDTRRVGCVAGAFLGLNHLFSSRLSSRLGVFSRLGTSCHVSRSRLSCQASVFVPLLRLRTRLDVLYHRMSGQICLSRQRKNKYLKRAVFGNFKRSLCRQLNARSLKRPMLHT